MKRVRDDGPKDSSIKQITSGKIFYDCPYPNCTIRAHNQHNLDKHIISHVDKEKKKINKNEMKM